jgi:hypothetical protein
MNARIIGHRLFTDGVTRAVYQDERGQFIASKLTVFGCGPLFRKPLPPVQG